MPPDTDGDGLADAAETAGMRTGAGRVYTTDPANPDTDGDGLTDGQEMGPLTTGGPFGAGTFFKDFSAPTLSDTDADGLNDAQEADAGTKPRQRDTDGDGLSDLTEIEYQFDPTTINADGDHLFDDEELAAGSDPLVYDFDTAGAVHAAISGLVFGDAWDTAAARWAAVTLAVATSHWYMIGTLASGFVILGDIRDLIYNLGTGAWGYAALAAVGLIPVIGDGAKVVAALADFAKRSATAGRVAFQLLFRLDLPPSVRDQGVRIVRNVSTQLPADAAVLGRAAPPSNFDIARGTWRARAARIGTDPFQAQRLQELLDDLVDRVAAGERIRDVRVNQRQVSAGSGDNPGVQMGINRPDLQYTDGAGNRHYVELDRPLCSDPSTSSCGPGHLARILANDAQVNPLHVTLLLVGPCQ